MYTYSNIGFVMGDNYAVMEAFTFPYIQCKNIIGSTVMISLQLVTTGPDHYTMLLGFTVTCTVLLHTYDVWSTLLLSM